MVAQPGPGKSDGGFRSRLAGSASEDEQSVGQPLRTERRHDHDIEPDLASGFALAIFPNRIRGAAHIRRNSLHTASVRLRFDRWNRGARGTGKRDRAKQQQECAA